MTRAHLALGSNLGDRLAYLQGAVDTLCARPDVVVVAISRVYETDPVGGPEQGPYLNVVVAVDTDLDPYAVLHLAHECEQDADRRRVERWGARTLDVDVLLYGDLRLDDPELTIPHPRMWERGFVLAPLRDVAPELVSTAGPWDGVRETPVALVPCRRS